MRNSLRALFPRVLFLLVAGLLSVTEFAWAQEQAKPPEPAQTQTKPTPKKPTRNSGWVTTSDPVALLSVRRGPPLPEAPTAAAPATTCAPNDGTAVPGDASLKNGEIALIEKQIQDRQKRIALLMRLFVNDERPFLNDPGNTNREPTAQERRKYEQDELLYETSEIARLREKLNVLNAASSERAAGTKP
jgi:hypothetical protein